MRLCGTKAAFQITTVRSNAGLLGECELAPARMYSLDGSPNRLVTNEHGKRLNHRAWVTNPAAAAVRS